MTDINQFSDDDIDEDAPEEVTYTIENSIKQYIVVRGNDDENNYKKTKKKNKELDEYPKEFITYLQQKGTISRPSNKYKQTSYDYGTIKKIKIMWKQTLNEPRRSEDWKKWCQPKKVVTNKKPVKNDNNQCVNNCQNKPSINSSNAPNSKTITNNYDKNDQITFVTPKSCKGCVIPESWEEMDAVNIDNYVDDLLKSTSKQNQVQTNVVAPNDLNIDEDEYKKLIYQSNKLANDI